MPDNTNDLIDWREARAFGCSTGLRLRQRYWLPAHGFFIGFLVLGIMWGVSHLQMWAGNELLAVRYLVTLLAGYLAYLLILRIWARALLERDSADPLDFAEFDLPNVGAARPRNPPFKSGDGGDFGGGGAMAAWDDDSRLTDTVSDATGGAMEAAGAADEGAVVLVPLVAVFLFGLSVLAGTGSLLLLYFGYEALLAVAVELAFAFAAGRASTRVVRQGWASAAVRLSWKPLLGALACAVLLGATLDYFLPQARSLPHAVQLLRG